MKKLLLSVSILAATFFLNACSKSNNSSPSTNASVMYVNGSAGSTPVNVYVNSSSNASTTNLAFLSNTGYQNVTAGSVNVTFTTVSSSLPLISGTASLTADSSYSVFAAGLSNSPTFFYTSDDLSTPASGYAKIRLVNLSSDALTLTANIGSTAFASGITSLSASSFATVSTGSYSIKAGDLSNINTVASTSSAITLNSGKIYTVIYTGTSTVSTGPAIYTVTVIGNN